MTRDEKMESLNKYCMNTPCAKDICKIYKECKDYEKRKYKVLTDKEVNELYNKIFVTDKLTGVITEEITKDPLRELQQYICDNYCKYPEQAKNQEDLDENHCRICPLNEL